MRLFAFRSFDARISRAEVGDGGTRLPRPPGRGTGPVGRYELSLRMAHDLCICILVPADAADVVQPIPYAVVEIPARAVDADDVLARDQVDVRGGRLAVLVQDAARAGHFFVDVTLKNLQSFAAYRVLKRGAFAFRKVAVFALHPISSRNSLARRRA